MFSLLTIGVFGTANIQIVSHIASVFDDFVRRGGLEPPCVPTLRIPHRASQQYAVDEKNENLTC